MTEKRQCVSCGAPLPIGATKCEYCGMIYEPDYWAGTVKYVPVHMGRRRLRAKVRVDDYLMDAADKEAVARYVRGDLVNQLAAGVAEMMNLRMHHDPCAMVTIVEGEVWVEEPDRRTAFFGMEGY